MQLNGGDFNDHKLGDSIANLNSEGFDGIEIYKNDLQFASIAAIDEARRINDRDAMFECKTASWNNKTRIPVGDCNSEFCGNRFTFKWFQRA